jgi:hypothetical protein
VARHLEGGYRRALAAPRLEDVEFVLFDGELDVLQATVLLLELLHSVEELLEGVGHHLLQRPPGTGHHRLQGAFWFRQPGLNQY